MSDARRRAQHDYASMTLMPWILGIVAYWIIFFVDPYHLRPGGPPFRVADHSYPDRVWPLLIGATTAEPHDVVLVGGSDAMLITPKIMREELGAQRPLNLSYLAPRPLDMPLILPKVAQINGLKHVILFMEITLMEREPIRSPTGDVLKSLADTKWSHRGDYSFATALGSLHALATGVFDLPIWHIKMPDWAVREVPLAKSADKQRRLSLALQHHAADVFKKSNLTCDQLPYLQRELAPFLREMVAKHIAVDLVFPPLSYLFNYDWIDNRPPEIDPLLPGPVFDQVMVFKRCVIAVRDAIGSHSARVLALDESESLSGNIHLYFDTIHLERPEAYRTMARMIAVGDDAIDTATIDQHEADLRSKIVRSVEGLDRTRCGCCGYVCLTSFPSGSVSSDGDQCSPHRTLAESAGICDGRSRP